MSLRDQLAQCWWLIAISIMTGVLGQTSMKLGVSQGDSFGAIQGVVSLVFLILRSPLILLGLVLYGIGALTWIAVLGRLNLSFAYPFLALNFVLIALISRLVLDEPIPTVRWLGIGCICVGIYFVAKGAL